MTTPPLPACNRIICTNLCLKIAPIDTINNYNPSQFDSNECSTGCICCHDRLVQFAGKGGGGDGDGGGGGCWLAHGLGWLSVRHCLISFVWTGTMLDEQKVFDTTSHPSHPSCQCVSEPNNSNNSLIDNKNFHGDERFALHATTGYKLFLCLHCIFNMNPLSLWSSCWSIVSSSCTPPLQFPGLPSNMPPQKQPL